MELDKYRKELELELGKYKESCNGISVNTATFDTNHKIDVQVIELCPLCD